MRPERPAVGDDQVAGPRPALERCPERVPVALVQAPSQGSVQGGDESARVDGHDQALGAAEFAPRLIDFGGVA